MILRVLLMTLNLVFGAGIAAWPLAVFGSIFFFDDPGALSNPLTIALAITMLAYPVPAVIGNRLFWRNLKQKNLPGLLKATAISGSGYLGILICFLLLELVCNGRFAC